MLKMSKSCWKSFSSETWIQEITNQTYFFLEVLFVWRAVHKTAIKTKIHITSRENVPISEINQKQVMEQKTHPPDVTDKMRKGTIYPTLGQEGGFLPVNSFGKHINQHRACGLILILNIHKQWMQPRDEFQGRFSCSITSNRLISEIGG